MEFDSAPAFNYPIKITNHISCTFSLVPVKLFFIKLIYNISRIVLQQKVCLKLFILLGQETLSRPEICSLQLDLVITPTNLGPYFNWADRFILFAFIILQMLQVSIISLFSIILEIFLPGFLGSL